jgi:hypothetical protein
MLALFFSRRDEAAERPKSDYQPKTLADLNMDGGSIHGSDGVNGKHSQLSHQIQSLKSKQKNPTSPSCEPLPALPYIYFHLSKLSDYLYNIHFLNPHFKNCS